MNPTDRKNDKAHRIHPHYDALKEAGASEEKARKAAETLASYENRFSSIESTLRLHSWMLTYIVALLTAIALKILL